MYQVVVRLLEPFTLLVICLAGALIWAWRRQRPRTRPLITITIVFACLIVLSLPISGFLAMWCLESSYPPHNDVPAPGDTVVVLSAGLVLENAETGQVRLDYASAERCRYAVRLYKRAGRCRIVLSGGKVDWDSPGPTLAETMRQFVVEMGIRPGDILLEEKSSNTYENAVYSKALLKDDADRRIWLVTAASHMNRAERCFRKQGFAVTPAPCSHETAACLLSFEDFIPAAGGLMQITRAAHEWQGRIWYRLRGKM